MKPQVVDLRAEQAPRRRRHRLLRQRHHRHLGGALHRDARRHAVLALRLAGDHGEWPALQHRRGGRLSRTPGRLRRRRRRVHHADGRDRHAGEIQPAGQGHRHQEQRARRDQVGADGDGGQSRSLASSSSRSTSRMFAKACGAAGYSIDDPTTRSGAARGARPSRPGT